MNLKWLESFAVAAEVNSFSEAAKRCNTVQSAISSHIQHLEDEVGQILFRRGRGMGMELTKEGQALLVYANRILDLTDEALDYVRANQHKTTIRLGTNTTLAMSVLPYVLESFHNTCPNTQIHIFCERSSTLFERFKAGEFDIAIMMDEGKHSGRVFTESLPLAWVAGPRFRLDLAKDIPLVFLTDGRDLRRFALDALDRIGKRGFIAHTSPHPVGVRAFVLANLALTVMPNCSVPPPLKVLNNSHQLPSLKSVAISAYKKKGDQRDEIGVLSTILQLSLKEDS